MRPFHSTHAFVHLEVLYLCMHARRRMVEVPRIRIGRRQTIETLINEEALLFTKYLRDERGTWVPRIIIPQ